jgi:hypothetical protein
MAGSAGNWYKSGAAGVSADTQAMQDLILSSVAPFDMTVTRSANFDHALYAWAASAGVGASYTGMGFDSSSFDPNLAQFGTAVKIQMNVPAGSHGVSMASIFPGRLYAKEQEWLLPANSSWVVTGKTMDDNGVITMTVDLVDQRNFNGSVVWP